MEKDILVPLTVPHEKRETFKENYTSITHGSGNLFLFSGDQKVEHLNADFYGEDISSDDASPEHLFNIASEARIGAFATQMGLISRYGNDYKNVNYIIKVNSKTNLVKPDQSDPISSYLYSPKEAVEFSKKSGLNICGFGYTVYIGSEYEAEMLEEAADVIAHAHKNGLVSILWMYPRGQAIKDERDTDIIAGAAGVGAALGADFIKINPPEKNGKRDASLLKQAILAADRTKVLCSGGKRIDENQFLSELIEQIKVGTAGTATGRNIHQKSLEEAVAFCEEIAKIVIDGELE